MVAKNKILISEILKALLKLIIAGIIIGTLKEYDLIIALIIVIKLCHNIYQSIIKPQEDKKWALLIGMILTGLGGLIGEYWGVSNGYWKYHNVERELPLWLPFAWMYAFYYLYKLKGNLIPLLNINTVKSKILLAFVLSLTLPAIGEMIAIYLGVWTYYWPYQLLGVPLYAFIALVFIHMLIYAIINFTCKKYKINDIVYG